MVSRQKVLLPIILLWNRVRQTVTGGKLYRLILCVHSCIFSAKEKHPGHNHLLYSSLIVISAFCLPQYCLFNIVVPMNKLSKKEHHLSGFRLVGTCVWVHGSSTRTRTLNVVKAKDCLSFWYQQLLISLHALRVCDEQWTWSTIPRLSARFTRVVEREEIDTAQSCSSQLRWANKNVGSCLDSEWNYITSLIAKARLFLLCHFSLKSCCHFLKQYPAFSTVNDRVWLADMLFSLGRGSPLILVQTIRLVPRSSWRFFKETSTWRCQDTHPPLREKSHIYLLMTLFGVCCPRKTLLKKYAVVWNYLGPKRLCHPRSVPSSSPKVVTLEWWCLVVTATTPLNPANRALVIIFQSR